MIRAGMDVARLNFSYGDYDFHKDLIKKVRKAGKDLKKPVAILQDLQGPKLRVGEISPPGIH